MNEEIKCVKLKPIYWQTMKAIIAYRKEHEQSPSVRELGAMLGISSTSVVTWRVRMLKRLGAIDYVPALSRSITITCDMIELDVDWHGI